MSNTLHFLICLQGIINGLGTWSEQDHEYTQYYVNHRFGVYENQRKTAKISKEEIIIVDKLNEFQMKTIAQG